MKKTKVKKTSLIETQFKNLTLEDLGKIKGGKEAPQEAGSGANPQKEGEMCPYCGEWDCIWMGY